MPSLRAALRAGISDLYFNSWRLVPANLLWGAVLLAVIAGAAAWPPLVATLPLLAVPGAGIYRMAGLIARGEAVAFADFAAGIRAGWRRALAVGTGSAGIAVVLATNLANGMASDGPIGWLVAVLAAYGLLALVLGLVTLWPILGDPLHSERPLASALRLAGVVVLARTRRSLGLTISLAAVLAISVVLFPALLTISIAYVALVSARVVVPLADALERTTIERSGAEAELRQKSTGPIEEVRPGRA